MTDLMDIGVEAYKSEYELWSLDESKRYILRDGDIVEWFRDDFKSVIDEQKEYLASKTALKSAILAIVSSKFPDHIRKRVEENMPWVRLLDSADCVENYPPEAIAKEYMKAIAHALAKREIYK
jgi:hypothetical protein